MTTLRTSCPHCTTNVDLIPDEVLLAPVTLDDGQFAFVCPNCGQLAVKTADSRVTSQLLAAGVVAIDASPACERHPEQPPTGPAFTPDDLLDLHLLLATEEWFDQLRSASPAH